uniref:Peptidase-like protein n=1 Tax=uncultured bacterium RM57 TaxID=561246 RepID=C8XT98_9BACT|nr:peptidase-like protein [uncultured bacterium RM57]
MSPLELVKLTALMERTEGIPSIRIGLIDGPVAVQHADLSSERLVEMRRDDGATCTQTNSTACLHATFIAGILSAKRGSLAPAICPNCILLIRPIFADSAAGHETTLSAPPEELAESIIECIDAGARVINLSVALAHPSTAGERSLEEVLHEAVRRGVIVVAAAGNQGTLGSSAITRHPWVIPVVACDLRGKPMNDSNLAGSIGRRGLMAPGDAITSLSASGETITLGGTSVAVPFVTGVIALLWSEFPAATAAQIKLATLQGAAARRSSVVPPLLNAASTYEILWTTTAGR